MNDKDLFTYDNATIHQISHEREKLEKREKGDERFGIEGLRWQVSSMQQGKSDAGK